MQNIYGVLQKGVHIDVSNTEKGAKQFATKYGYTTITIRYNCGYIAEEIAYKRKGKWYPIVKGQKRYKAIKPKQPKLNLIK